MITLLADTAAVLAQATNTTGEGLANALRDYIAPFVLLAIGLYALSFLKDRQINQFIQFAAIAVAVGVFFYVPGIIEPIARLFAGFLA